MLYESQGIFAERWAIDFRKEAKGITNQYAKSKKGRTPKEKREADCQQCGKTFTVGHSAIGKYCSLACTGLSQRKNASPSWVECSRCFAKAGIGMTTAARLLRTSKKTIHRVWKMEGIVRIAPPSGEWRRYAQRAKSSVCGWWGNSETAVMWMSEYKEVSHDWSSIWNSERIRRYQKAKYHALDPEKKKEYNNRCSSRNPEKSKEYCKRWKEKNPERNAEINRRASKKMRSNPLNRIVFNMRNRFKEIMCGMRTKPTQGKWALIGCSQEDLKRHLEKGFNKKMSWANYGTYWHVDHILPCSSFDHTDPKQVAQCWHWTNLRALEASRNISKSDKITEPQMSLLLCATH
jgi:hypothetical protein